MIVISVIGGQKEITTDFLWRRIKENGYGNVRALPSFVGKAINLRASSGFMPFAFLNAKLRLACIALPENVGLRPQKMNLAPAR